MSCTWNAPNCTCIQHGSPLPAPFDSSVLDARSHLPHCCDHCEHCSTPTHVPLTTTIGATLCTWSGWKQPEQPRRRLLQTRAGLEPESIDQVQRISTGPVIATVGLISTVVLPAMVTPLLAAEAPPPSIGIGALQFMILTRELTLEFNDTTSGSHLLLTSHVLKYLSPVLVHPFRSAFVHLPYLDNAAVSNWTQLTANRHKGMEIEWVDPLNPLLGVFALLVVIVMFHLIVLGIVNCYPTRLGVLCKITDNFPTIVYLWFELFLPVVGCNGIGIIFLDVNMVIKIALGSACCLVSFGGTILITFRLMNVRNKSIVICQSTTEPTSPTKQNVQYNGPAATTESGFQPTATGQSTYGPPQRHCTFSVKPRSVWNINPQFIFCTTDNIEYIQRRHSASVVMHEAVLFGYCSSPKALWVTVYRWVANTIVGVLFGIGIYGNNWSEPMNVRTAALGVTIAVVSALTGTITGIWNTYASTVFTIAVSVLLQPSLLIALLTSVTISVSPRNEKLALTIADSLLVLGLVVFTLGNVCCTVWGARRRHVHERTINNNHWLWAENATPEPQTMMVPQQMGFPEDEEVAVKVGEWFDSLPKAGIDGEGTDGTGGDTGDDGANWGDYDYDGYGYDETGYGEGYEGEGGYDDGGYADDGGNGDGYGAEYNEADYWGYGDDATYQSHPKPKPKPRPKSTRPPSGGGATATGVGRVLAASVEVCARCTIL